jgi:dipeptidyl aminopeptidase/acylaminoacyl peptidase
METLSNPPSAAANQSIEQQPVLQNPLPPSGGRKRVWVLGVILLVVVAVGGIGYFIWAPKGESPKKNREKKAQEMIAHIKPDHADPIVTPTPMPFRDMTIPYLREKTYTSKLSELQTAYDGSNYTAYTTSYTSDGLNINGLLTRPTGEEPAGGWPAIVFVHGYIPPSSYETQGQAYSSYVDYLASRGFVVFKIDLRGHAQSEGEPSGAYFSSDYITDVLNAYAALQNTSFINKKRVGLWGHSMAGNVLMRSWAVKKDIPAIVIWAGAVYTYEDMLKYRITDASYQPQANNAQRMRRRQELYEKYGSPSASVKFWQEVAPVSYLNELKGAIQIHHAVDDDVVNIAYSRELNALLEKTSLSHEFYEYPSGGHNISGTSYNEAMQRTAEFYTTHLK